MSKILDLSVWPTEGVYADDGYSVDEKLTITLTAADTTYTISKKGVEDINTSNKFIKMGAKGITLDGNFNKIKIITKDYPGFVQNGYFKTHLDTESGYENIKIKNCFIDGTNGRLDIDGGWLIQKHFATRINERYGRGSSVCEIKNCFSYGTINGLFSGGIVGANLNELSGKQSNIKILNCYSSGDIVGHQAGGIVGYQMNHHSLGDVLVDKCYSVGSIIGTQSGGILGKWANAQSSGGKVTVKNCYSSGNIIGPKSGGILGTDTNYGSSGNFFIMNTYSFGKKIGENAGGIFGLKQQTIKYIVESGNYAANGLWSDTAAIEAGLETLDPVVFINPEGDNQPWLLKVFTEEPWYNYDLFNERPQLGVFTHLDLSTWPTSTQNNENYTVNASGTISLIKPDLIYVIKKSGIETIQSENRFITVENSGITIDGLNQTVTVTSYKYPGFVQNGTLNEDAKDSLVVKNLYINGSDSSLTESGGWLGQEYFCSGNSESSKSFVENCYSNGDINGETSGGIIGSHCNNESKGMLKVKNCYSNGGIHGADAGGIVGCNSNHKSEGEIVIDNCFSNGYIDKNAGGIIGSYALKYYSGGKISVLNCYSTGDIGGNHAGGITGHHTGSITPAVNKFIVRNCYSNGKILGKSAGGIFGSNKQIGIDATKNYFSNNKWNDADALFDGLTITNLNNSLETEFIDPTVNINGDKPWRLRDFTKSPWCNYTEYNSTPIFSSICVEDQHLKMDEDKSVEIVLSAKGGAAYVFSITQFPEHGTLQNADGSSIDVNNSSLKGHTMTYTPQAQSNGKVIIEYKAYDVINSNTATITIDINPIDDVPVFTSTPPTSVLVGDLYQYNITVSDNDSSDIVTIQTESNSPIGRLPEWLELKNNKLSGTPTEDDIGRYLIHLKAVDNSGLFSMQKFEISVTGNIPSTSGWNLIRAPVDYFKFTNNNNTIEQNTKQLVCYVDKNINIDEVDNVKKNNLIWVKTNKTGNINFST